MAEVIYAVVKQMADKYSHAGISLSPKKNTALAPMTQEIIAPIERDLGQFSNAKDLVDHVNDRFDDGDHTFDFGADDESPVIGIAVEALAGAAIEELRPIVIGLVKKTKDVVLPAVNSIVDGAYKDVSDDINGGKIGLNLVSDKTADGVWTLDYLQNTLFGATSNSDGTGNPVISSRVSFRDFDDSQLEEIIKTGDSYVDNTISEYLNRFNRHEALEYSYHRTFRAVPKNTHECQCPMLHAFLSLLMAYRFLEETPSGVSGESLEVFEFEMTKVINYWAGVLKNQLEMAQYRANKGIFINAYQEVGSEVGGGAVIVVNDLLLDRFDEEIGDVDVVFGASVADRPVDFDSLKNNIEGYRKRWLSYYKICQSARNDRFQSIFCSALAKHIRGFGKEFEYDVSDEAIADMFRDLSYVSLNNETSYNFARKHIINILFKDENINKLLDNADEFLEKEGEEDRLDIALEVGLIDLLAEWAIKQMDIKG